MNAQQHFMQFEREQKTEPTRIVQEVAFLTKCTHAGKKGHTVKTENGGGADHEQVKTGGVLGHHLHGYAWYDDTQ